MTEAVDLGLPKDPDTIFAGVYDITYHHDSIEYWLHEIDRDQYFVLSPTEFKRFIYRFYEEDKAKNLLIKLGTLHTVRFYPKEAIAGIEDRPPVTALEGLAKLMQMEHVTEIVRLDQADDREGVNLYTKNLMGIVE